ncbi:PTS glucose transporter subunit IIA [Ruminococcaceae bacterium OttesenSCG-928-D13]|nr:PTS glucose transporter subunit IIA [Ruminococcaceae bacterium OttesenSCG-928-D13]
MLNFLRRKKATGQPGVVLSPQDGEIFSITEMPDPIFAEKILGDGVCILPANNYIYSPVDGCVDNVAGTGHAMGIISEDGAEIMIHIGVDTVELKGQGFKVNVKQGQKIKAGDLLCEVDVNFIKSKGYKPHTAVVLTNGGAFSVVGISTQKVKAGKDVAFRFAPTGATS